MLIRLAAITAAIVTATHVATIGGVSTIDTLLRTHFRFSAAQVADVERGRAVTMSLPGSMDREMVAAGAVRIDAPAERLVEVLRDIEKFERGGGFLKTVRISDPPRVDDFASLSLPAEDVADLRRCRPGDCDVRLGERAFEQLAGIDRQATDADAQIQAFARRMAFDAVEGYRKRGNWAFGLSLEEHPPRQVAAEFDQMLAATPWLTKTMPGLADYLARYPNAAKPEGMEEYFYWSFVEFGLKTVLRVNHVVMYPLPEGGPGRWALANRQIYASHYFQNALEVRLLVDDPAQQGRAHYLMVLNVARPDGTTGLFGALVRYKIRSGSREALRKTLVGTKQRCETGARGEAPVRRPELYSALQN